LSVLTFTVSDYAFGVFKIYLTSQSTNY